MAKPNEQFRRIYAQIIAKAWSDEAFKQRLLSEPAAVLQEHGITIPPGIAVKVMELEPKTMYLAVPPRPEVGQEPLAPTGDVTIMSSFSIEGPDPEM